MLDAHDIDHILENDKFSPREKEMLLFIAKFLHHVVTHHSRECSEFIELFNLCAKPELLEQLENLITEYYRPQTACLVTSRPVYSGAVFFLFIYFVILWYYNKNI